MGLDEFQNSGPVVYVVNEFTTGTTNQIARLAYGNVECFRHFLPVQTCECGEPVGFTFLGRQITRPERGFQFENVQKGGADLNARNRLT